MIRSSWVRFAQVLGVCGMLLGCTCNPPECLKSSGFTETTLHQVGQLEGEALVSTGQAGVLLYGPYVAMQAGKYRLTVRGQVEGAGSGWVDVVSQKGVKEHAKFPFSPAADGSLVQGQVVLEAPVEDLEVRVYVGEKDKVKVLGYELVPAKE